MPVISALILLLVPFFLPLSASAQTPTPSLGFFTRNPWPHPFNYPCTVNTGGDPEFHPLRPYPGNPCDPLIPRKIPEAPNSSNPEKQFLTFNCAKSLNVSGSFTTGDVVDICKGGQKMAYLPTNPILALAQKGSCTGPLSQHCSGFGDPASCINNPACYWTGADTSDPFLCRAGSYNICVVKRIEWNVSIDLSSSTLPFSGNTELPLTDPTKVNSYLSWYLNGTINQSEQLPLDTYSASDNKRITSYSGPLNKLYPKTFRDPLKQTLSETGVGSNYHNYIVACQRNIDDDYVSQVLKAVLDLVFGNFLDSVKIAEIIIRVGFENISALGQALIEFASLPFTDFNEENFVLILGRYGLDVLANDAGAVSDLINLGRNYLNRIGVILQTLRTDMAESCQDSSDRHRLDWVASNPEETWIKRYVPYSTLEDTTSEVTVSVIPSLQPANIDGRIIAMRLYINSPSDSRLYFSHFRSATTLSEMLNSLHKPIYSVDPQCSCTGPGLCGALASYSSCVIAGTASGCSWNCNVPSVTPAAVSYNDQELIGQVVDLHQGIDDSTPIQREYSGATLGATLIRNTEVRVGESAPAPLYTNSTLIPNPVCDIPETRLNQGDKLLGKEINGGLVYYQVFEYAPKEVIDCSGGCSLGQESGGTKCATRPCVDQNVQCSITDPNMCCTDELQGGYGGTAGNCPWETECKHADAEFNCVPSTSCIDYPGDNTYIDLYPFSCNTRTDSNSSLVCCGPQYLPESQDFCVRKGGLTGSSCRGVITVYNSFCSGKTDATSCGSADYEGDGEVDCLWSTYTVSNTWNCDSLDTTACTNTTNSPYCEIETRQVYGGHTQTPNPPQCPAWPNRSLSSAARVHPFTKTPFIEKIYDLLVANPQSLLHRWLPKLPLTATSSWEIKTGRDNTIPATTVARYTATTDDLSNTRTTAGQGGSGALYFPHVGSLADHILGLPTSQNLNLQRMLRPKGFIGWVGAASSSGSINCNTNVPDQNLTCVNKANYIDVAKRWTSMPDGTHAEMCFNDVVFRASQAGVNPGLSLLIWLNESDTSNYAWFSPVEDFGVHTGIYNTPNDFNTQITGHLLTVNSYKTACASAISKYGGCRAFAAKYLSGSPDCTPNPTSDDYCAGLITKWGWIGGSCPFPFP